MSRTNQDKNLKESAIHRSGKLPLKIYADDYVPYHWHEEYEILYIEEGQAQCTINGVQICLEKGKALLIQSGDLHAFASAHEYLSHDPRLQSHPPLRQAVERMFASQGDIIS